MENMVERAPRGISQLPLPRQQCGFKAAHKDAATIIAAQRSRWKLEQHLSEADRSRQVKCVCGALGAPIHCHAHAKLVQRVLS